MPEGSPRVLIVRLSAIGDVIHVLPALAALRQCHPRAHIGWLAEDRCADLLQGVSEIDTLHLVPRRLWKKQQAGAIRKLQDILTLRREVAREHYDTSVDFQGLTKSGILPWLAGIPRRVGYGDRDGRELNKLFTNTRVEPPVEARHVIDRNLALLKPLGIEAKPAVRFPLALHDDDARPVRGFVARLRTRGGPLVVLNPGAGWPTKLWPVGHFAELARRLARNENAQVAICWAPGEEQQMAEQIVALADGAAHLAPATTLRQLAALLAEADLLVAADTGPLHLGGAVGVPVLGLYGASDPHRNGPYGANRALSIGLPCSPCWRRRDCPFDLRCMRELTPARVHEAARQLMRHARGVAS